MTRYIYLGYGTTDNNGVATLDHDANGDAISHSYTGTGAGKIDIIGSLDSTITDTSETSPIYELWDTLWYDEATEDQHKTWTNTDSITETRDGEGTTITEDTDTQKSYTSNYTAIDNVVIEMDITATYLPANTSQIRFRYKGSDNYIRTHLNDMQTHHMKFVCENGTVTTYTDDEPDPITKSTTSATGMGFTLKNSGIRFKDIKVYKL